jgi:DNA primase
MPPSVERKRSLGELAARFAQSQSKLLPSLTARGLGVEAAERFSLGYVEPDETVPRQFWHRMSIPYATPGGIVQIRYRCLIDHHAKHQDPGRCPKFLGEAGTEITLYNASAVLDATGPLILCEGEPDVWAVETLAGLPAVGVPGAESWTKHPYWARCFVGQPRLILAADGDDAGTDLAKTVRASLPEIHVVRFPDGDDANSVLARDRSEFFTRCGLDQPAHR